MAQGQTQAPMPDVSPLSNREKWNAGAHNNHFSDSAWEDVTHLYIPFWQNQIPGRIKALLELKYGAIYTFFFHFKKINKKM